MEVVVRVRRICWLALVAASCGSGEFVDSTPRDCTQASHSSMVIVTLPDPRWQLTELCVGDTCVAPPADAVGVDADPAEYPYRLTVTDTKGAEIKRGGVVMTEPYYINGKGCEPRTANAALVLHLTGDVTITHP